MNRTANLLCAHSALVFVALLAGGFFGVAGWLPLVEPTLDAEGVKALFEKDRLRIRVGITMVALGATFWWSFSAAIGVQMRRIEGDTHPLTYTQISCAAGTALLVIFAAYFWLAMAYRPTTSPETMQIFNDLGWLIFIGAYPPALLQMLTIGYCILSDKREDPIFPRWVAYATLWAALTTIFGAFLPFFYTGPFAWNGLLGFWLVAAMFFGWVFLMWWATARAIKRN